MLVVWFLCGNFRFKEIPSAMKIVYTLILLFFASPLFAQKLNGLVFDKETRQPVYNANITMASFHVVTSTDGKFTLNNVQLGDKLDISCVGYETYHVKLGLTHADPMVIYLSRTSVALQEFKVIGMRNYKKDSLQTRKDFKSVFSYKPVTPTIKNMFIFRSVSSTPKTFNGRDINSTSSLVSFDLMPLLSLLGAKKNPVSKLKKKLLQNEEDNYVDQVFSRQQVAALTKLEGDSLENFMATYRPSIAVVRMMSSYEMLTYIKKQYSEFIKPGGSRAK